MSTVISADTSAYQSYLKDLRFSKKEAFEREETLTWLQVCRALCPPSNSKSTKRRGGTRNVGGTGSRAEIPIVDTVHISPDGLSRQWFFTSRTGRITRKSNKNSGLSEIFSTFQEISKSYKSNNVAIVRRGPHRENVLIDDGFGGFKSALSGADCLSAFIPPKGTANASGTSNFRDLYTRSSKGMFFDVLVLLIPI